MLQGTPLLWGIVLLWFIHISIYNYTTKTEPFEFGFVIHRKVVNFTLPMDQIRLASLHLRLM